MRCGCCTLLLHLLLGSRGEPFSQRSRALRHAASRPWRSRQHLGLVSVSRCVSMPPVSLGGTICWRWRHSAHLSLPHRRWSRSELPRARAAVEQPPGPHHSARARVPSQTASAQLQASGQVEPRSSDRADEVPLAYPNPRPGPADDQRSSFPLPGLSGRLFPGTDLCSLGRPPRDRPEPVGALVRVAQQ
jgi:hypothetical protein